MRRQGQSAPAERVGHMWKLETRKRVLQAGEVTCLKATFKLTWDQPGPFVVLEKDEQVEAVGKEMIPS